MKARRLTISIALGLLLTLLVAGSAAAQTFPDVPSSHSYYTAIEGMVARGAIGGYENGDFGPSDLVKRQQFAKMIVKTLALEVTE